MTPQRWRPPSSRESAGSGIPGRGQGLAGIKRYLTRWNGKLSIRSGTARIAIVPPWDDDVPMSEDLPFFPGTQLQVVIPAQAETDG